MTLHEAAEADGYLSAPRIGSADVRLLWHCDYWDGPRSGMLRYHGEECWFQVVAEDLEPDAPWHRRFAIVRLTAEQHADEVRWHDLFREHVGTHTDYDPDGRERSLGEVRPRELWARFYDAAPGRVRADLSGNEVLGWFER